jgi:hypothetical protein
MALVDKTRTSASFHLYGGCKKSRLVYVDEEGAGLVRRVRAAATRLQCKVAWCPLGERLLLWVTLCEQQLGRALHRISRCLQSLASK